MVWDGFRPALCAQSVLKASGAVGSRRQPTAMHCGRQRCAYVFGGAPESFPGCVVLWVIAGWDSWVRQECMGWLGVGALYWKQSTQCPVQQLKMSESHATTT